jgi:hypothetical protein
MDECTEFVDCGGLAGGRDAAVDVLPGRHTPSATSI